MILHNFKKSQLALVLAAACAGFSGLAHADDAQPANSVRLGAYYVHFDSSAQDVSGPFTPAGINLSVSNTSTVYFGYVRHLDSNWSIELAGGLPPNTKTYGKGPATVGSVPFNGQEVATAKWFSPSLLAEYSFCDPSSSFRPYVGLGFNFTKFYDRNSTPAGNAANGGPTAISLSNAIGPAATLGIEYKINRDWGLYASYSAASVDSHYTSQTSGIQRSTTIHFDPQALVVAVGYSF